MGRRSLRQQKQKRKPWQRRWPVGGMAGGGGAAGEYRGGRRGKEGRGAERGEGRTVIHFTPSLFILDK